MKERKTEEKRREEKRKKEKKRMKCSDQGRILTFEIFDTRMDWDMI